LVGILFLLDISFHR